jgi:predicted nucleotidyltransferase
VGQLTKVAAEKGQKKLTWESSAGLRPTPRSDSAACRRLAHLARGITLWPLIVNAASLLTTVTTALAKARLEAILIGNAAAAIHGAPVTTVDFDFMFRATPVNLGKLKRFAANLGAVIMRPYYPASALYRVVNDDSGLQVDFMPVIHGVKSFNSLRSRAEVIELGSHRLRVAGLADIIASKRAAGRPRDKAVLEVLEKTLREKRKTS